MERRKYSNEFKEEAVKLAERRDIAVSEVARNLGVNVGLLNKWIRQFGAKPDGTKSATPDEHAELFRLRRELKRTQEERDILKKAMGIFTRELP